jgi:hypothetical protein
MDTSMTRIIALLPDEIVAMFAGADEAEAFESSENTEGAIMARMGALQIVAFVADQSVRWHRHDSVEQAQECYQDNVTHARETQAYLNNGGNPAAWYLHKQQGLPLDIAEGIAAQMVAVPTEPESAPAPAIGRAQVPGVTYVSGSVPEPPTGLYL